MNFTDIFWFILLIIVVFILFRISSNEVSYYVTPSVFDSEFAKKVRAILGRSKWSSSNGGKYKIVEVNDSDKATILINLADRKAMDKWHTVPEYYPSGKQIRFSITTQSLSNKPQIYIDENNWLYGVPESGLTVSEYQEYVINHEFGHGLGYDHQPCKVVAGKYSSDPSPICPVMYQMTRGVPKNTSPGFQVQKIDFTKRLDMTYL